MGESSGFRSYYHLLTASLAEARGELREAIREVERSLVHSGGANMGLTRLAHLYEELGDTKSAEAVRARMRATTQPEEKK